MPKSKKINLVIVTPTLMCGGAEKNAAALCNHINLLKFDVTLLILDNANQFYPIENLFVKIIDLQTPKTRNAVFKIKKQIQLIKPDLILSFANHINLFFAIFKNTWFKNIPIIARETSIVSINSTFAKLPKLYKMGLQKFYKNLDFIICQSYYMQADLVNFFKFDINKTTVIYNGIIPSPKILLTQPSIQLKFITVARLSNEKGIERILNALAKLSISYKYYIIGNGPQINDLKKLTSQLNLSNNVFFLGQKNNPFQGMEDANLFLMGSYYEGLPNALIEAGSYGIPIVAYNAPGGIAEVIDDGENGFLVNDNKNEVFVNTIQKAVYYNFDRSKIQQLTLQKFSLQNAIFKTEQLLLKQIGN